MRLLSSLFLLTGFFALLFLLPACGEEVNPDYQTEAADPAFYHASVKQLTDVIVHDIFSPPVASRIYSYANIAGYEVMAAANGQYASLGGQVTDFTTAPQPETGLEYCYPLAAVHAFNLVGKSLIFSEEKIDKFQEEQLARFAEIGIPGEVMQRSLAYGEEVAKHVIAHYDGDMYKQTRTFPKFAITNDETRWQPTPPDYMDGIEPSWAKIRPFTLVGADQFKPAPPTPYSTDKSSLFWEEVLEVYHALDTDDPAQAEERIAIAKFWDCNPYVSHHNGHLMFATKKITPGGHWINIVNIVAQQAEADLPQTIEAYTLTSIAMFDGFISCWEEKYRSNLLRPETFINRNIDETWTPLLQTPPFPEYTSGHSVVSRACAVVLTRLFGDNFAFDDTSEEEFGLPTRSFTSLYAASEEAAASRLYGGIHYRPAIDNGVTQGEQVGNHVLEQVTTRTQLTSN